MPTSHSPPSSTSSSASKSAATWAARGRADAAERIGARRRDASHTRAARPREAAPARPDAPGSAGRCWPARRRQRHPCRPAARRSGVSGPGQNAVAQPLRQRRPASGEGGCAGGIGDMDDQRMIGRPAFGREDPAPPPRRRRRARPGRRPFRSERRPAGRRPVRRRRARWRRVGPVQQQRHALRCGSSERRQAEQRRGLERDQRAPQPDRRR